jgi:hypothetical protein
MLHTTDDNSAFGNRLGSENAAIDGIERGDETDDANVTASPLEGTAGQFDDNGDGEITTTNLISAVEDFGAGELTVNELLDVIDAF